MGISSKIKERRKKAWKYYVSGLTIRETADQLGINYETAWKDIHATQKIIGGKELSITGQEYLARWVDAQNERLKHYMTMLKPPQGMPQPNFGEKMRLLSAWRKEQETSIRMGQALGILNKETYNYIEQAQILNLQQNVNIDVFRIMELAREADKEEKDIGIRQSNKELVEK